MKQPKKKRQYVTEILREKILIDAEEGDVVFETVEEVLA
jgi:hypothetical protein